MTSGTAVEGAVGSRIPDQFGLAAGVAGATWAVEPPHVLPHHLRK